MTDLSVNSWYIFLSTANSPGHNTGLDVSVGVVLGGTNKWTATVSRAGVDAPGPASTDETFVEIEVDA